MADLLRRHGALDDLPHLDQIGVRRTAIGFSGTVFTKSAQDWSQFTLLELLAVHYHFLASSPNDGGGIITPRTLSQPVSTLCLFLTWRTSTSAGLRRI